jgi:hypothetical protein
MAVAMLGAPAAASAGTYDVVSCGAPGAGGVNRAWQSYGNFDDAFTTSRQVAPTSRHGPSAVPA